MNGLTKYSEIGVEPPYMSKEYRERRESAAKFAKEVNKT